MPLLKIEHLSFLYPEAEKPVLSDIHFEVERGEMVCICGPTGSGKSTLLHLIKKEIAPLGVRQGNILFKGKSIDEMPKEELIRSVGIVFQNPESQTVMDTVLGEMAFALENMGLKSGEIRRRVSEVSGFFGLSDILSKSPHRISGGQRQMVNLCAVLAMKPELILLDEPFSQLDPIAQNELLNMILRVNREFGITVILCEHKTEELISVCDRLMFLDRGRISYFGTVSEVVSEMMKQEDHQSIDFLPASAKIYAAVSKREEKVPLSIREGRDFSCRHASLIEKAPKHKLPAEEKQEVSIRAENLLYSYPGANRPVLKNLDLSINKGDFCAIMGGNGSGKSTLLKLLGGLLSQQDGTIELNGKNIKKISREEINRTIFYIPQNPALYFTFDTVKEELEFAWKYGNAASYDELLYQMKLEDAILKHPYDLSGGESQKLAILCAILRSADILLLDEATKGIDVSAKDELSRILRSLLRSGKTILFVSHDVEFAVSNAEKFAILFDGALSEFQEKQDFFRDSFFYNTAVSRMLGDFLPDVFDLKDVMIRHV